MKLICAISLFACCFAVDTTAGIPVSSQDLAEHLGINKWVIPKESLPPECFIRIRKIRNGTLDQMVGGYISDFRATNSGDVVICASNEGTKWHVSISQNGNVTHNKHAEISELFIQEPDTDSGIYYVDIPSNAGTGIYALCGRSKKLKFWPAKPLVEHFASGVALEIIPASPVNETGKQ